MKSNQSNLIILKYNINLIQVFSKSGRSALNSCHNCCKMQLSLLRIELISMVLNELHE